MFTDRIDAATQLAELVRQRVGGDEVVVLGLPRGGVPVAAEVAEVIGAPLDVIVVRKLGVPQRPEVAMGAIGEGGARFADEGIVARAGVSSGQFARVEQTEREILTRRLALLRRGRSPTSIAGRTVLIVDDGIATGATARVACRVVRERGAAWVIVAVPVAPADSARRMPEADEVVAVLHPDDFRAVGQFYREFPQTGDDEVILLLEAGDRRRQGAHTISRARIRESEVRIPGDDVEFSATMASPPDLAAFVVFAHGSGSSRHSPRNRLVASALQRAGLGTLLVDLLTGHEESNRANVFDIDLLGRRLISAVEWLGERPEAAGHPIGFFGASTGAGAALWAAADPSISVAAVVSRGGRPDLAGYRLADVRAPTLLIVGGDDTRVIELNRFALAQLTCPAELAIVPGATHLFEEPGTLAEVAVRARDWLLTHLAPGLVSIGGSSR